MAMPCSKLIIKPGGSVEESTTEEYDSSWASAIDLIAVGRVLTAT